MAPQPFFQEKRLINFTPMKKTVRLLLAIVLAIGLSAFFAPVLYSFMPYFKFEKILNRLLMISIVLICIGFLRFDRSLLETCGMAGRRFEIGNWLAGFLISCVVLALLSVLEVSLGAMTFGGLFRLSGGLVVSALTTAVTVGIIEEFFFRGFLYLKLRNIWTAFPSLVVTNLIYSLVHFLKGGKPLIGDTPGVIDSFRVLGASFNAFLNWPLIWPAFLGLFFFGLVLSFAFQRSKSLLLSMGIHSGAVFYLKMTSKMFSFNPEASILLYGGKSFYSGLLGWVFIGLIGLWVHLFFKKPAN